MINKNLLGFDIGGTKCTVCLGNSAGKPFDKITFPTVDGFEANWQNLSYNAYEILKRNKLSRHDITAIGVSCGGPLDSKCGIVMSPPNLPGWDDIHIIEEIESEFKIPAFLMNDANACALAEWCFGAGQGCDNMIFLTMGTGLGGGIIINGRFYDGASGMSGEFGHIRLRSEGPVGFGKNGSFEGFCGGNGIANHAQIIARNYRDRKSVDEYLNIIGEADFSVKNLDIAQSQGNRFALDIFKKTGSMLGEGLAILIDSFNPEKIVIGSIFERSENLIRPSMEKTLARETLPENLKNCQILPAMLGDKIGDYACLLIAKYGLETNKIKLQTQQQNIHKNNDILEELLENYPILENSKLDIKKIYEILVKIFSFGGKLMICGNGGSASDAQHIVGELMKDFTLKRAIPMDDKEKFNELFPNGSGESLAEALSGTLPVISLTGEQALNSALINDVGSEIVYAQQVYGLCSSSDALLALSTSGNSANIVNAVKTAKIKGATTLAITGQEKSELSSLCDVTLQLPALATYRVQELTLPVYHAICRMLEVTFWGKLFN